MPTEMTPAEAAKNLKEVYDSCSEKYNRRVSDNPEFEKYLSAVKTAASVLCKVANGELAEVVHAHWVEEPGKIPHCSACGFYSDDADQYPILYCSNCGRRMDGKGGSDNEGK